MPEGEDEVRKKYFDSGRTHPSRRKKRKTGFEGNNWPSTRTFYSDIPLHIVGLSKTFYYYVALSGLNPHTQTAWRYLEGISKKTGYYVSNYTISGMLNRRWGVRHRPKPTTQLAIQKLIEWLIALCRETGVYKPFEFKYDKSDMSLVETKTNKPNERKRKNKRKEEGWFFLTTQPEDAPLYRRRL